MLRIVIGLCSVSALSLIMGCSGSGGSGGSEGAPADGAGTGGTPHPGDSAHGGNADGHFPGDGSRQPGDGSRQPGDGTWPPVDGPTPPADGSRPPPDTTQPAPARLHLALEPIAHDTGFAMVTNLAFFEEPAGQLLMTDRDGGIAHFALEGNNLRTLTRLTVPDVWIDGAAGLLALAIDPDHATNHFFYVAVSVSTERNIIRRYTLHPGDGDATVASQVDIFDVVGERAPRWHNIATIGFDENKAMWALVGEKGLFEPAQDLTDPLGSLIRIVPSRVEGTGGYTLPEGQPVYGPEAHGAIYAKGLRSPWKGLYNSGTWFFGDVGKDAIEEINFIDGPTQNFGWPKAEGPCTGECDGFVEPWIWYGRSSSHPFVLDDLDAEPSTNRSVYVGWIYHARENDPYQGRWNDVITYGDHYVGWMRGRNLRTGDDWHAGHMAYASGFAQAPDGYVYATALATYPPNADSGPSPVYRVVLAE